MNILAWHLSARRLSHLAATARILGVCLIALLTSCTAETTQRPLNPTEQLWRDAYCNRTLVYPADAARITRWAKANYIECK